MDRRILKPGRIAAAVLLLSVGVTAAAAPREPVRPAFVSLAPGLEYRHETRAHGPLSIHVLSIDRLAPSDGE
jgi:hypothetical protein